MLVMAALLAVLIMAVASSSFETSNEAETTFPVSSLKPSTSAPPPPTSLPTALPETFRREAAPHLNIAPQQDVAQRVQPSPGVVQMEASEDDEDPTGTKKLFAIVKTDQKASSGQNPAKPTPTKKHQLTATDEAGATLSSNLECSLANCDISVVKEGHFTVQLASGRNNTGFFTFRLQNAAQKPVRIDLKGAPSKWGTLNPLLCTDEQAFLDDTVRLNASKRTKTLPTKNGPLVPDTTDEPWQFLTDISYVDKTLTINCVPPDDDVLIAMRPVFSPMYLENYLKRLGEFEQVILHQIGLTPQNRPLHVIEISDRSNSNYHQKPTLFIYAREHGDEHDGSWLTQGAIEYFLNENDEEATRLLRQMNVLVVPILDPDGAASSNYHRIVDTFHPDKASPESRIYAQFLTNWYNAGGRIDVAINLHNVESAEAPHLSCGSVPKKEPDRTWAELLHVYIGSRMNTTGANIQRRTWGPDNHYYRLGGWLEYRYGTLRILYEANSQAKDRHLNLDQLRWMGATMAKSAAQFLTSRESSVLRERVERMQRDRFRKMLFYVRDMNWQRIFPDAFRAEFVVRGWTPPEQLADDKRYDLFVERLKNYPQFR